MSFALLIGIAILQGLTEFLPVSSSGHLTLTAMLFDLEFTGALRESFFVLLHVASLLATCWWLRRDIWTLLTDPSRRKTLLAIAIAVIPAGLAGLALKHYGGGALFSSPLLLVVGWLITTAVLLMTMKDNDKRWTLTGAIPPLAILLIGMAQAVAIIPGVSRSGATIATALLCGMAREDAFRFSFLISIPVIAGAALLDIGELQHLTDVAGALPLAGAFVICILVSLAALAVLQNVVLQRRLHWFAPYTFALAIVAWIVSKA